MWSAAVVIPLAAMVVPMALVLLAVLFDLLFLGWFLFRMWHDFWAVSVGAFISDHLVRPVRAHLLPQPTIHLP